LFQPIDKIVHGTLYNYGLQFNYGWATPYWDNYAFYQNSLIIAATLTLLSVVTLAAYHKKNVNLMAEISLLLSAASASICISAIYFLTRIDNIVNETLYSYGLIFSNDWATSYWTYLRLTMFIAAFAGAFILLSMVQAWRTTHGKGRIDYLRLLYSFLILAGTAALIISIATSEITLAFIGLGLLFWGTTFTYIRTEEYVKKSVLEKIISQDDTLNRTLKELGFNSKPFYLPPRYFKEPQNHPKAYISKQYPAIIPRPEEIREHESQFHFKSRFGALFTPSGAQLEKLIERTLRKDLSGVDIQYLQMNLSKALIENLELVKKMDVEVEWDILRVKLREPACAGLVVSETSIDSPNYLVDPPLSSAIACAIAKSADRVVTIQNQYANREKNEIVLEYRIIQDMDVNP
jgi:hypothetical protein